MPEYIEREALLENKYNTNPIKELPPDYVVDERDILDAPTADVAPVVHGRWEERIITAYVGYDKDSEPIFADRRYFVHRECGRRSAIKEAFCPRCGAKMDLEVQDGE